MNDATIHINERLLSDIFKEAVKSLSLEGKGKTKGKVRFFGAYKAHLRGGTLKLVDPNPSHPIYKKGFIEIKELDIVWDLIQFGIEINLDPICIGGQCIIPKPKPWGGCLVRLPKKCFFNGDPDLSPPAISIPDFFRSEISLGFAPKVVRGMSEGANGEPPRPQWHIVPQVVWDDIDIIDIADTVADLIERLVDKLVEAAFSWLPDWARDIINSIVGGLVWFIRKLLDLTDDLSEWLAHHLRHSLGFLDIIAQYIINYFQKRIQIAAFDNPMTILKAEQRSNEMPALPPVLQPISQIIPEIGGRLLKVNVIL